MASAEVIFLLFSCPAQKPLNQLILILSGILLLIMAFFNKEFYCMFSFLGICYS